MDPTTQLAAISQTLQNADVYLRGIDSFLKTLDMRVTAAEQERVRKQTEHDTDIESAVKDMHAKTTDLFTKWEAATALGKAKGLQ